jgi:hypothetical protein
VKNWTDRAFFVLWLTSISLLSSHASAADPFDSAWSPFIDVYLTQDTGSYEFEDKVDSGRYSTPGLGLRAGYSFPYFFVGFEGSASFPTYSETKTLDSVTRAQHFIPTHSSTSTNFGGTAIVKLGRLNFFTSLYVDSQLSGKLKSTGASNDDATFTYYGVGARAGIEYRIWEGLTIGASLTSQSYDEYSLDKDTDSLAKTEKAKHGKLSKSGGAVTLTYKFPIKWTKK